MAVALTAYVFDSVSGADTAAGRLRASAPSVAAAGYALVAWENAGALPVTEVHGAEVGHGGLDSAFWSLLLGLTFSVPLLGAAAGQAAGPETGSLAVAGISEAFLNRLRDEVTPGRSALLLYAETAAVPTAGLLGHERETPLVLTASPTDQQEKALLQVFGV